MLRFYAGITATLLLVMSFSPAVEHAAIRQKRARGPNFLGRLEYVLRTGLQARDGKAITACCALLIAPDKDLIDEAVSAVRLSGNKAACQKVLDFGRKTCLQEDRPRDHLAGYRAGHLAQLSYIVNDGRSYLVACLYMLTVPRELDRIGSVDALKRLHKYLRPAFGKEKSFPTKLELRSQIDYCRQVRRGWEIWLKGTETAQVHRAVSKWLAQQTAKVKR